VRIGFLIFEQSLSEPLYKLEDLFSLTRTNHCT